MRFISILLFLFVQSFCFAQVQSPEQFLGYKVGQKVTPNWRVLDYYAYIAKSFPKNVKMEQYGTSYEGRPLYVFFISSEKNITDLENIRLNNLRLAQSLKDQQPKLEAPAIVWMSNNVHGNETSSTESSMLTIYALLNPSVSETKGLLENVVLVMDPCLNPDGTERYNNWYNGVVGKHPNSVTFAREHDEPWPGGRYNHYYFDLNRDWAWQTQKESEQRVALYNKWLPQIHVDFHEQGINQPYYFPPAAEPLHEIITPWQRSLQTEIGKHNAAYFDKQGWLYFTGERFDLFYPSYGDTYPMYNGAIGMTYEQAGNTSAGLSIIKADLDTLTLVDRSIHHHASAVNVLAYTSQHVPKIISEFKKFFDDASAGKLAAYQTYVVKYNENDRSKIIALKQLLDKNGILSYSGSGSIKGFDYASKKEVSYAYTENDVLIPGNQSKASLISVLFEPESKLTDSVTYDITAWSLPYVYGLDAIASKTKIASDKPYNLTKITNQVADNFGYAFKWNGFSSAQLTAALLKNKIAVKFSEEPFTIAGVEFPRGSIHVLPKANTREKDNKKIMAIADSLQVQLYPIRSGIPDKGSDLGSPKVSSIKAPNVVLFTGETTRATNIGEVWHYFDEQLNYPITLVNVADFNQVEWPKVDVVILANGSYSFLKDSTLSQQFQSWVSAGGKVIAMQNAVDQLASQKWSTLKVVKADTAKVDQNKKLLKYGDRERLALVDYTAGAIFKLTFDNTHPLMFGYESYYTLKQDDELYSYFDKGKGWNVGYLQANSKVSGFVGEKLSKRLNNGLVFAVQDLGRGHIIYLRDNVLFRNFWENGKLIMANAVFLN
ncbi:M14 family metallopeptidase [Sphingobacterium hungaricum]